MKASVSGGLRPSKERVKKGCCAWKVSKLVKDMMHLWRSMHALVKKFVVIRLFWRFTPLSWRNGHAAFQNVTIRAVLGSDLRFMIRNAKLRPVTRLSVKRISFVWGVLTPDALHANLRDREMSIYSPSLNLKVSLLSVDPRQESCLEEEGKAHGKERISSFAPACNSNSITKNPSIC